MHLQTTTQSLKHPITHLTKTDVTLHHQLRKGMTCVEFHVQWPALPCCSCCLEDKTIEPTKIQTQKKKNHGWQGQACILEDGKTLWTSTRDPHNVNGRVNHCCQGMKKFNKKVCKQMKKDLLKNWSEMNEKWMEDWMEHCSVFADELRHKPLDPSTHCHLEAVCHRKMSQQELPSAH